MGVLFTSHKNTTTAPPVGTYKLWNFYMPGQIQVIPDNIQYTLYVLLNFHFTLLCNFSRLNRNSCSAFLFTCYFSIFTNNRNLLV